MLPFQLTMTIRWTCYCTVHIYVFTFVIACGLLSGSEYVQVLYRHFLKLWKCLSGNLLAICVPYILVSRIIHCQK
jgi:hypothetical protein